MEEIAHISERIPFFEHLSEEGRDVEALPSPRIFKTHLPCRGALRTLPRARCRHLYIVRDGRDVAVSYYHFHRSHLGFQGEFDAFFERFMRGKVLYGSWFAHVAGWVALRDDPRFLLLRYEEMLCDLAGSVRAIAAHCGIEVDPERFPQIVERCRFEFMKQHESRFEPNLDARLQQRRQPGSFLREGKAGGGKTVLTEAQQARFEAECQRWFGKSSWL
jgi:hypothetical protein